MGKTHDSIINKTIINEWVWTFSNEFDYGFIITNYQV